MQRCESVPVDIREDGVVRLWQPRHAGQQRPQSQRQRRLVPRHRPCTITVSDPRKLRWSWTKSRNRGVNQQLAASAPCSSTLSRHASAGPQITVASAVWINLPSLTLALTLAAMHGLLGST